MNYPTSSDESLKQSIPTIPTMATTGIVGVDTPIKDILTPMRTWTLWAANIVDGNAHVSVNPGSSVTSMAQLTVTIGNTVFGNELAEWCRKVFGQDNYQCYEIDRGPVPWSTDFTFYGDAVDIFRLTWMDQINA